MLTEPFPVPIKESPVRGKPLGWGNLLPFEPLEVLAECLVRAVVAEPFAQDKAEVLVEGDEVAVEGGGPGKDEGRSKKEEVRAADS